jgi:hypothetical protein
MTIKSKKIRWVFTEVGRRFSDLRLPAHEGLEDSEEQAAIHRHLALFPDIRRIDAYQGILREGGERVVCLIREDVPVRKEENARKTCRLAAPIPAAMKELPRDLRCDKRLARAVARVSRMRSRFSMMASSTRSIAMSWS